MRGDGLRIAMVASPWYPIPPHGYGGIERIVHLLASGLSQRGHHVTVFGAEGTTTGDDIRIRAPQAWSDDLGTWVHKHTFLARVYREVRDGGFDLVHEHTGTEGMLLAATGSPDTPAVATMHEPVGEAEAAFLAEVHDDVDLVALSESQRTRSPTVRWSAVIPNAVDPEDVIPDLRGVGPKGEYLVQLARIDVSKGQHLAIEAARRAGRPLVLAGKLDRIPDCEAYFREHVEPHLDGDAVTWIPEVRGRAKAELLARAAAMVFPILWEEPFGLAMAEAMANGTPVVAFDRGAARELVRPGVTGFLAQDVEGVAACIPAAAALDPGACAADARARFAPDAMLAAYESCYRAAVDRHHERRA